MNLESLGADNSVRAAFETYSSRGLVPGRVAISHRDQYRLLTAEGDVAAEASGGLWYRTPDAAGMPVVGDWVAARMVAAVQAIVEAVLPRRSLFSRRAAGRREDQQPIAANVDVVFLVCGLDGDFNLRRLERYLTLAAESGAAPVVVLNKADLCGDLGARVKETVAVAGNAPVVAASAESEHGLDGLMEFVAPGRTVALLGSSGVGKSTIVNRLLGEEHLRTGEVRSDDSHGRHTTTHRELVLLPRGGVLIDTPGMRELQLWAGADAVDATFAEIQALAANCRYGDCSHEGEPGCAVERALADGSIARDRWESYRKLLREAARHDRLADPLSAQEYKRKLKQMHKAYRNYSKG